MKKSLLIAPLFVLASFPAIAQLDQNTNASSSDHGKQKCSVILNILKEASLQELKTAFPHVKYEYIGSVKDQDNSYAYKFTLDGENELIFMLKGNTGEIDVAAVTSENKNAKPTFMRVNQDDVFICQK